MRAVNKIFLAFILACLPASVYAQKLAIIYTGDSSSSLYPCGHCPASVGGGVARRAKAIAQIKKEYPLNIVIDAGNFIAGGPQDTNSLNPVSDKQRSQANIKAMNAMGYEMAVLGSDDFNFGADFLNSNIKPGGMKLISADLEMKGVLPYYLKTLGGLKIAVIGLSPLEIYKKSGVKIKDYSQALEQAISSLKGKADVIILVSSLGDQVNAVLAEKFTQIHLIISSGGELSTDTQETIGKTILARPSSQGRELRFAEIDINNKEASGIEIKSKKLSLDVEEDPAIKKMIPCCFKDGDCRLKDGSKVVCSKGGSAASACDYVAAVKIPVSLITVKDCQYCSTAMPEGLIKMIFPGAAIDTMDYRDEKAVGLIKELGIKTLPAFILPGQVKTEKDFAKISSMMEEKAGRFLMLRELSGVFMQLDRQLIKGRLDFFIKLDQAGTGDAVKNLEELAKSDKIDLRIHFSQLDEEAPLDEVKLALAVKKIYPDKLGQYIDLRAKESSNIYWQDSLKKIGVDFEKIKAVAKSAGAGALVKESMELSKQLGVVDGNVMLVENQKVFRVFKVDKEQIKKLLGGI